MNDPYNLMRFVTAQEDVHLQALEEIRAGRKLGHWMWYMFPQFAGLGGSAMSQTYAIRSKDEALAYLDHNVLGPRYEEAVRALDNVTAKNVVSVFGEVDTLKLLSSLTLFCSVKPTALMMAAIYRIFDGRFDLTTVRLLDME